MRRAGREGEKKSDGTEQSPVPFSVDYHQQTTRHDRQMSELLTISALYSTLCLFSSFHHSVSPSSFHLSSSHPPPLYRSPSTTFLVTLFHFFHFSMLLWHNKICCAEQVKQIRIVQMQ